MNNELEAGIESGIAAGKEIGSMVQNTFSGVRQSLFGGLSLSKLIAAVVVLLLCLLGTKLLLKLIQRGEKHSHLDEALRRFLLRLLKIALVTMSVMIAAGTLGVDVTSLVTVLGIASLAISLALQGTLSNLVGGVMLLSTRPFKQGDLVQTGGLTGRVEVVGLFYTKISTPDNTQIFVPNSTLSGSTIINYTAEPRRRVDINVTASYDSDSAAVRQALVDAVQGAPGLLAEEPPMAAVDGYNANDISYVLRFWVNAEQYFDARFAVLERIKHVFDERGLAMSYPHLNVHFDQEKDT